MLCVSAVRNVGSDHVIRKLSRRPVPLEPQRRPHELEHRVAEDEDDDRDRGSDPHERLDAAERGACAVLGCGESDGAGGHSTSGTALDVRIDYLYD